MKVACFKALEGLIKTARYINRGSRYPGRDLNPGSPIYETGVFITKPRR
jgi:hypothetical protein